MLFVRQSRVDHPHRRYFAGVSWACFGLGCLGPVWGSHGRSYTFLGQSWASFGPVLGLSSDVLGLSWAVLGLFQACLGLSWACLGLVFAIYWGHLWVM